MEQLLAHLLGDFIVQNHWMANRKTQVSWIAALHAALYGLGFLVVYWTIIQVDTLRFGGSDLSVPSWAALAVIVGTHFVIDRWRLARVITNIWGTGKPGVIMPFVARMAGVMEGRGGGCIRRANKDRTNIS